jgi:hypothetical protein
MKNGARDGGEHVLMTAISPTYMYCEYMTYTYVSRTIDHKVTYTHRKVPTCSSEAAYCGNRGEYITVCSLVMSSCI